MLRPFVVAGEEAVEDFLEASLRAFAARRFCLDADSADIMLCRDIRIWWSWSGEEGREEKGRGNKKYDYASERKKVEQSKKTGKCNGCE